MEKLRELIASELDEVIAAYDPLVGKLTESQKQDLERFKRCRQILIDKVRD